MNVLKVFIFSMLLLNINHSLLAQDEYLYELNRLKRNLDISDLPLHHRELDNVGEVFEIQGKDKNGRIGRFQVFIITQKHKWILGDTLEVENGNLKKILPEYMSLLPNFKTSVSIITLGTASNEGGEEKEFSRSQARAKHIAQVVLESGILGQNQKLFYLPIGQHIFKSNSISSRERPVIVIGTIDELEDSRVDLYQSLIDAISQEKYLSITLNNYSRIGENNMKRFKNK